MVADVVVSTAKSFPDASTLALVSDVQFREPYSSGAVNRKFRGIVDPGIYKGFIPSPAGGLTLQIASGEEGGTASVNIDKFYQITVRQQADVTLEMTAGKTAVVVLEASYVLGQETYQVNANSAIQAVEIKILDKNAELNANQLELCTVTIPGGATELTEEMIDLTGRKLLNLSTEYSNDFNSDEEGKAATPKALKDGLAGKQPLDETLSELSGKSVEEILEYLQLRESFSGVVGQSRNARMSVTSATQSATFTADELIVETSVGQQYRLSAFNKTVNLGATGAGGMDTGSVPSSGFIALYAILNPTNGATALLAVNATASSVPEIYGGANMPAGYTASALVSVWRVASGQFTIGEMVGRQINTPEQSLVTVTNTVSTLTELSISSAIPKNAKTMEGWGLINSVQTTTNNSFAVSSKPYSLGFRTHGSSNSGVSATFSNLLIAEPQKIYYQIGFGGTPTPSTIYSTGYSF